MLQAVLISTLIASASAFVPSAPRAVSSSRVFSSEEGTAPVEFDAPPAAPVKAKRLAAQWLPASLKQKAPLALDGTLAGDVGFDPLGFSKSKKTLFWMREAETKHGRLAMLAAAGWPLSELWHKEIGKVFNLDSILAEGDRAPSLLNGGLSSVWASGALIMSIIIGGYLESKAMNSGEVFWNVEKSDDYIPGNLGFDPLNLYSVKGGKKSMETAEVKNGRLAMIAITGYAFAEAATGLPVVQQTPMFF